MPEEEKLPTTAGEDSNDELPSPRLSQQQQIEQNKAAYNQVVNADLIPERDARRVVPEDTFGVGEYVIDGRRAFVSILREGDDLDLWDTPVFWSRYKGAYSQNAAAISTMISPGETITTRDIDGNPIILSNVDGKLYKNGKRVTKLELAIKHHTHIPNRHQSRE